MDTFQYIKDMLWAIRTELLSYRVWVALGFAAVLICIGVVAVNWPKNYVSSATIVKDVTNVIEPLLRGAAEVADIDKKENVSNIVYSRPMLEEVLRRVNPDFEQWTPEELALRLMLLRSGLSVQDIRGTNLTRLTYRSPDPDVAYHTLTAVVDTFIENRMQDKQKKSHEAHDFISKQVDQYKRRLVAAEEKLKDFKASSVDETELSVKERMSDLAREIQELEISIDEARQRISSTRSELRKESENVSLRKKASALEGRRAELVEQLDELRLVYQDSYPDIVTLKLQIAEVDTSMEILAEELGWKAGQVSELPLLEELRKQLSAAEVDLETRKRRKAALEKLLAEERILADTVVGNQAELAERMRDYDVTKKLYEEMLRRKENAKLTLALNDEGQGETYKVAESPIYPLAAEGIRALYIFLAAPILAFAAPIGLISVMVVLDPRIRSVSVLNQKLPEDMALLAKIPHRSTSLGQKLLRKDIFLLLLFAMTLMGGYVYSYVRFQNIL